MIMDLWDNVMMLALLVLLVFLPRFSPCCGCMMVDDDSCRRDCLAYRAYVKKYGMGE